mgnify:CR=1 FL=1
MVSDFSRIITLLRKEKGVTQKQAAEDLGVSQALLSHYEKGIRECGLEFVVRVADYYGVSCDYLLGRSADRSGLTLSVEDIPSPEGAKVKEITALDEEIFNTLVDSIEVGTLDIQFTLKNDLKLKVERKQV